MARLEKSIEIKAPVEKVWELCADVEGYPRFMETAKEIRKTGAGTYHWTLELGGRTLRLDGETIEIVEKERLAWTSSGDFVSQGSWRLEPTAEGTKLTNVMDYELPGLVGAIMDRIKVSKEMEKNMERNLNNMKALLEGK